MTTRTLVVEVQGYYVGSLQNVSTEVVILCITMGKTALIVTHVVSQMP